ncbi:MAG: hypothetical protein E7291_08310 [Lachnospiraceae bacterium]|nr:hypothetical protein [Lachnospiraceae bacterium]
MAQRTGKTFYTEVVEHFFRMAVRHENVSVDTPAARFRFTKRWINNLTEDKRVFIEFVFGDGNLSTMDALYAYRGNTLMPMYQKRVLLSELERQYAIDSKLISSED